MRKWMVPLMAIGLAAGQISVSHAQTFAQFIQANATPGFTLTGGTTGSGTLAVTPSSGIPIVFQFKDLAAANLLNTNITAMLTMTATSSDDARQSGSNAQQDFNSVKWTIVATSSAGNTALGIASGANLLTGTSGMTGFNGGTLSGATGGNSATFAGSDVSTGSPSFFNTVAFASSFINFSGATNKAYAYSFTSVNPIYFLDGTFPDFFIRTFSANGTGTFSEQLPGPPPVPEPGTLAMFIGMGVSGGMLGLRRRRVRK